LGAGVMGLTDEEEGGGHLPGGRWAGILGSNV
jgi:hypothetical protein